MVDSTPQTFKITEIYAGQDGLSHFREISLPVDEVKELGAYSQQMSTAGMFFRVTMPGLVYEKHNAPRQQYIIYLEGQVKVTANHEESRIFGPGDILLASDTTGEGHISESLSLGRSIVIPKKQ